MPTKESKQEKALAETLAGIDINKRGERNQRVVFYIICALLFFWVLWYNSPPSSTATSTLTQSNGAAQSSKPAKFKCLSSWDGSHRQSVQLIKSRLKDPDSFEHIETGITEINGGVQSVRTTYRAKNSFGGYAVETYSTQISHSTCEVIR